MRKLKLQMQTTVDGFVAKLNGEQDWLTQDWDDEFRKYEYDLIDSSDTLLMGRGMTEEFFNYWTDVAENQPKSVWYEFAKKMVDVPKVVFTKTLDESPWANTTLSKGDLVDEVNQRKNQSGKDILVYGGAGFVSSLIKENLIDEYYFFVNPVAIGEGMTIFNRLKETSALTLLKSQTFECGVILQCYEPKR
jgi:dihydrofolate reductase